MIDITFMATYRAQGQGEEGEAQPRDDRGHRAEASGLAFQVINLLCPRCLDMPEMLTTSKGSTYYG